MEENKLIESEKLLDARIVSEGWLPLSDLTEDYMNLCAITHIDTRDFHFNVSFESQLKKKQLKFRSQLKYNKKYDILTYKEVIERLKMWKEKTGGEREWRMINHKKHGWFKYVRIIKYNGGFIWCSDSHIKNSYMFYTNNNLEQNMEYEQYGDK
jgi:hypothetical protein